MDCIHRPHCRHWGDDDIFVYAVCHFWKIGVVPTILIDDVLIALVVKQVGVNWYDAKRCAHSC